MKDQFSSLSIRQYWNFSMEHLPSYHHAPSTLCYREEEVEVIKKFLSPLKGKSFLKTDLWNEVKNTRILPWAATPRSLDLCFRHFRSSHLTCPKILAEPNNSSSSLRG